MSRHKRVSAGTKALIPHRVQVKERNLPCIPLWLPKLMTGKKKKKLCLEVENYVLFDGFLNTTAEDRASQIVLRNYSKGIREEPDNIEIFLLKKKSM